MTVFFKLNQVQAICYNLDSVKVAKNTNGDEVTIPPGYYAISDIITILNTMSDTSFSLSVNSTCYLCIWMQRPFIIDFSTIPDIREILERESDDCIFIFVPWNQRD